MKTSVLFSALALMLYSCHSNTAPSNSNTTKNDTASVKTEQPKANVKGIISAIAGKYYIPTNKSKSNLIFTINQNLNLQFLNYNGNYEGKLSDGKIQFDDTKATKIEFILKDSLLTLKNENDVTITFREANTKDLIIGNWCQDIQYDASHIIITKDVYEVDDYWNGQYKENGRGKYVYKGDNKFVVTGVSTYGTLISGNIYQLIFDSPDKFTASCNNVGNGEKIVSLRTKMKKMASLNTIFN